MGQKAAAPPMADQPQPLPPLPPPPQQRLQRGLQTMQQGGLGMHPLMQEMQQPPPPMQPPPDLLDQGTAAGRSKGSGQSQAVGQQPMQTRTGRAKGAGTS